MKASDRDSLYVYDSYECDISFVSVHGRFDFKKVPLIYSLSSVNKYLFIYVELYALILFSPFATVSRSLYLCLSPCLCLCAPPPPRHPHALCLSPPPVCFSVSDPPPPTPAPPSYNYSIFIDLLFTYLFIQSNLLYSLDP